MANESKTDGVLLFLKVSALILASIGVVMATRRMMVLNGLLPPANRPGFASFDEGFGEHVSAVVLHIVPGALFMISGVLQFMPRIRVRYIQFHRWSGRVFILSAYVIGATAIFLSFTKPLIGGVNEAVATVFFSILFLLCVSLAFYFIRRKEIWLHREWMIRTFSLGLAIATVRLITVFVFAVFKLPPQVFLGTAFWMGFTLHAIVAEVWIQYTRKPVVWHYANQEIQRLREDALYP